MMRFIILSFAVLGWGFYELSGGADFEPGWYIDGYETATEQTATEQIVAQADPVEAVSRDDTSAADLVSVAQVAVRPTIPEPEIARAQTEAPALPIDAEKRAAVVAASLDDVEVREPAPETSYKDIREVAGTRVNLRDGPGTQYSVVASLSRGDPVIVLDDSGNGWLRLEVYDSGRQGWMAASLVTAAIE